jgi:hypothetical protein
MVLVPTPYRPTPLAEPRRFRVGELPPESGTIIHWISTAYHNYETTEKRELPFRIYGVAEFERKGSDWKLARLRIDKSVPSDEYDALVATELADDARVER